MATGEKQCVICHICSVCGESIRHPRSYTKRSSLSVLLKARAARVVRSAVGHRETSRGSGPGGSGRYILLECVVGQWARRRRLLI